MLKIKDLYLIRPRHDELFGYLMRVLNLAVASFTSDVDKTIVAQLKTAVEAFDAALKQSVKNSHTAAVEAADIDAVVNTLYQNEPNPFTESTLIQCDVAEDVVKADLYIYNMNGEQIAEYAVSERGETSVTIDGGSLNGGMYLYALIADGKVIDTKRMILTK